MVYIDIRSFFTFSVVSVTLCEAYGPGIIANNYKRTSLVISIMTSKSIQKMKS